MLTFWCLSQTRQAWGGARALSAELRLLNRQSTSSFAQAAGSRQLTACCSGNGSPACSFLLPSQPGSSQKCSSENKLTAFDSSRSGQWHMLMARSPFATSTSCCAAGASKPGVSGSGAAAPQPAGTVDGTAAGGESTTASKGSDSNAGAELKVPPAVAAGAAAAGEAATKAAKSVAKQASRLVKLIQATSLSEATWLQLTSIWQSHSAAITAVTAAAAVAGVYQVAAAAAAHLLDMSDPAAQWSCLAASAAVVAAAGLQIRSSFTVDPERVYRITMRKLNRHAGLQEVMGSPLAGSDVRLELVTQGSLFVQETLLPKRRAPRLHLMFQLTGPTKTGVVSVEAKKVFGSKYAFKTLMVELPDKALTSAAAGAAAAAAASKVRAAGALGNGQQDQQASDSSSTSSGSSSSASSSSQAGTGGGGPSSSAGAESARIYIIGGPAGGSSSSQTRHMSPAVLLEDLKNPMLYALKHNLRGYEAADETEGQLAWSKPQHDPDQATWWDDTKKGSKLLACRAYVAGHKAAAAATAAVCTAVAKLRAQASSRKSSSGSSSSHSAPGSTPQADHAARQAAPASSAVGGGTTLGSAGVGGSPAQDAGSSNGANTAAGLGSSGSGVGPATHPIKRE